MSDIHFPASPNDKLLITREALDNLLGWVTEAQNARAILTDLIAELRLTPRLVSHWRHDPALESPVLDAVLDRAEQRLREVQGE